MDAQNILIQNNNFIVIVGIPASGKTYLGKYLSKLNKVPFLDDPLGMNKILKFISLNSKGIIADPNLCIGELRKFLKQQVILKYGRSKRIKFLFFENNIDQCLKNDQLRYKNAKKDIFYFSSIYKIPSQIKPIKVFGSK